MTQLSRLVVLSTDLLSSVRIADTGTRLGYAAQTVDAPVALRDAIADIAVIDVAASPLPPPAAVLALRAANPRVRVVALYRHTDPEQARAARAAGCDLVLNRAQFFGDIAAALARVAQ